ncbi:MFS transporter [Martelella alba]|uniref:MFS transporter n=1 Tax=Martelella alba TaxID=2590451 RepID=A0ABY2SPF0_9HYPH|nr:MFS transporter [Martelella alba]TKI07887.1 MFS transporter [Martelella alba]
MNGKVSHDSVLQRAINKAKWRIIPCLILMYLMSYLDRVNVSFAKSAYQASTGLSDAAFAFGAGIFFISYALFELPSNLLMHRVGPRLWLVRIMVTWGLVSTAMSFAWNEHTFYLLRILLGVVEAGFFPTAIYFIAQWFPSSARAHIMGIFYFGSPIALIIGGPISGLLLDLHGLGGWEGWQIMFAAEGLAASVLGVVLWFFLHNSPQEVKWLSADEKRALTSALNAENEDKARHGHTRFIDAARSPILLHFAAIYFLIQITGLGVAFYLPTQVAALLGVNIGLEVGLVTAIPWLCALVAGATWPGLAARKGTPRLFGTISLCCIALGLIASGHASPLFAIAALSFVTMGIMTAQPIFWTWPTRYYGGAAAAASFAVINSCGAVGGFVAPNLRTWAEIYFHTPVAGLYALAIAALIAVALFILLPTAEKKIYEIKGKHYERNNA